MNPSDLTAIKRALVKIWFKSGEDSFFKGTGFFIHSEGYLLTAYHCVKDCKNNIVVESLSVGKKRAVVVPELSLPGADIAVLQLSDPSMENTAPHYLPLGFVTDAELNSDVVVLGYPQRDGAQWVAEVATYQGHINRLFREGEVFFLECQAIVGKGQSGSPVYHPATRRVVAVAHSMYEGMRSGDAVRFEPLFDHWIELNKLNHETKIRWDQQIVSKIGKPIMLSGSWLYLPHKLITVITSALLLLGLAGLNYIFTDTNPYDNHESSILTFENDIHRPGFDYHSFTLSQDDPETCRLKCQTDPKCVAFDYVKPDTVYYNNPPACWLKDKIPPSAPNTCCISGIKNLAGSLRKSQEKLPNDVDKPQLTGTHTQMTSGACSPIVEKVTGNVSVECISKEK